MKSNKENDQLWALRHSAEHVLTMAMLRLYPGLKAAMGPATDDGFYFDFDVSDNLKISLEDFPKIEEEMWKIIKEDLPIIKDEMTVKEARKFFSSGTYKGNEYKHEWLDEIEGRGEKVAAYWMGEKGKDIPETFVDICAGPHAKSTGEIKAFKLLKLAGAYWHGDEMARLMKARKNWMII
jgi:threonyl-tRNA synthetase